MKPFSTLPIYTCLKSIFCLSAALILATPGFVHAQTNRFEQIKTYEQQIYSWTGAFNEQYEHAGNWTPQRSTPNAHDILIFTASDTVSISSFPMNTIGRMSLSNGVKLVFNLNADSAKIMRFCQPSAESITIGYGASLSFAGKYPLHLDLYGHLLNKGTLNYHQSAAQSIHVRGNLISPQGVINMEGKSLSHMLRLGGEINSVASLLTSEDDLSFVSYEREGDQEVFASPNYTSISLSGSGSKQVKGNVIASGVLHVEEPATLTATGHYVRASGKRLSSAYAASSH